MTIRRKQVKRRNQTVNQAYLERFASSDGQLTQVILPGDKRARVGARDATVHRNFYVVTRSDGTEDDSAEDAFGIVEDAAARAFRALVDEKVWPVPGKIREDIATWAALQHMRTPWVRILSRELLEEFKGAGALVRDENGEPVVLKMPEDALDDLPTADVRQLPRVPLKHRR